MGLCCGRGVWFNLVLRYGVHWHFLFMMEIRVNVEIIVL